MIELRFGEGNRFEQIESGEAGAATRSRGRLPIGQLHLPMDGPRHGNAEPGLR